MAATPTVNQHDQHRKFETIVPRNGVVTLFGYGIRVSVDRGHLTIQDGIGGNRREARFARVGHGLRRLVIVSSDGVLSLKALRWLADQGASLSMLDRSGRAIVSTGPISPSDARLRRSQALAFKMSVGLEIARKLIERKLDGQERIVRSCLSAQTVADSIARYKFALSLARSIDEIRALESSGAHAYWSAWRAVPIKFPTNAIRRIPAHWQNFGTRISPLTQSPRLAVNPANAMLNYLYAILETEARFALVALGLDPGLGVLHFDSRTRDSLACDLMEAVRPEADSFLLTWITNEQLRREWFFEDRNGNCRLMPPIIERLSETARLFSKKIAPHAEWLARCFSQRLGPSAKTYVSATRLTGANRQAGRGIKAEIRVSPAPQPPRLCKLCGAPIVRPHVYCQTCARASNTLGLIEASKQGRIAAQAEKSQAMRSNTQLKHAAAQRIWKPNSLPSWLNEEAYRAKIQPRLTNVKPSTLALALGISVSYAIEIRRGSRLPHRRHWITIAKLTDDAMTQSNGG